jgi:hypothetical protein
MVYIYILKLEYDKYYIGRSKNSDSRIRQHFRGGGSAWTTKYMPLSVYETYDNCDIYDEDKYTIMMMAKYGIENVRGGSFITINLSVDEIKVIRKMIDNANDTCFNCKMTNHLSRWCKYDEVKNNMLTTLRNNVIEELGCKYIKSPTPIEVNTLRDLLVKVDNVIFNGVDNNDIYSWIKDINDCKIKGIKEINVNYINGVDFIIGLGVLLDKKIDF